MSFICKNLTLFLSAFAFAVKGEMSAVLLIISYPGRWMSHRALLNDSRSCRYQNRASWRLAMRLIESFSGKQILRNKSRPFKAIDRFAVGIP